jgi:hypothetical protein
VDRAELGLLHAVDGGGQEGIAFAPVAGASGGSIRLLQSSPS